MKPLCQGSLVLILLVAPACDTFQRRSLDDTLFGDAYQVTTQVPGVNDAPLDVTPHIAKDLVSATVQYAGGCRDHTFRLQSRQRGDLTEIWYVHDAHDDACEALVTQSLSEPLPDEVPDTGRLVLLTPLGSRFDLR